MIWNEILLELRGIRIGQEMALKLMTGFVIDLRAAAEQPTVADIALAVMARRGPRDHTAILHSNPEAAAARERLDEMGDDTLAMLDYIRKEFGPEAAEGMKQYYEKEIVGGRR